MYTAAIVGLGNIALGYDITHWKASAILTHAKAYMRHPGFELKFGIDPLSNKRRLFTKITGLPAYESLAILRKCPVDVVSVCVPTSLHFNVIGGLLSYIKPKVILCEKPIADNMRQAQAIIGACEEHGVRLAVNYIRQWDPAVIRLKQMFAQRAFGRISSIHCYYTKGLFNNGSHFIELLHYWFGTEADVDVITAMQCLLAEDIDASFLLYYNKFFVFFQCVDEHNYSIFEMDIITQKARIKYSSGGSKVSIIRRENDPIFKNYKRLSDKETVIENGMRQYQLNVLAGIYRSLRNEKAFTANGKTAGETLLTCLKIKSKCKNLL